MWLTNTLCFFILPSPLFALWTYASIGVPCWLVMVFGVFGFLPSSYIVPETRWPQGRMVSGQGQNPPGLGPHMQDTWYSRYKQKVWKWFVCCLRWFSLSLWKAQLDVLENYAETEVTGKSNHALRHLCRVIWLALMCEWIEGLK